jgi:hypothetical protein
MSAPFVSPLFSHRHELNRWAKQAEAAAAGELDPKHAAGDLSKEKLTLPV